MTTHPDPAVPIGKASKLLDIPVHTIRYWEKEFAEFLHPQRSKGSRRLFGSYEIDLLRQLKAMLWEEKYSIAGARQKLRRVVTGKDIAVRSDVLEQFMEMMKRSGGEK